MYDNDIILNKKDNGDVIESSKAWSIFNANIATLDYENEQFSGKSVWMKGRLTCLLYTSDAADDCSIV